MLTEDELLGVAPASQAGAGTMLPTAFLPRVYDGRPRYAPDAGAPASGGGAHFSSLQLCFIETEAIMAATARIPDLKYVLYVGAAPGDHIVALMELFPNLEFHLFDSAPSLVKAQMSKCAEKSPDRVLIYERAFTDHDAAVWGGSMAKTIFICDVHSGSGGRGQLEFSAEIEINMDRQRDWWVMMQPAASLLKFRLPQGSGDYHYLDGKLLLQPFGPATSEGRLLVWKGAGPRQYSLESYWSYFRWLNGAVRGRSTYDHGLAASLVPGICNCFDCARTVQILREYVSAHPASDLFSTEDQHVAYCLGRAVTLTEQRLTSQPHGAGSEAERPERAAAAPGRRGRGHYVAAVAAAMAIAAASKVAIAAAPKVAIAAAPKVSPKFSIEIAIPSARALRAKK